MKTIPHPIQYQGSKRNLAQAILRFAPSRVDRLIEPFAGSAALSIAAAANRVAKSYLISDFNKPLVELLEMMVQSPSEVSSAYERIWEAQHSDSIQHYYTVRETFNRTKDPLLFLYLLARCVKGSVRYNSEGQFNQSPDKRRRGTLPNTMRSNITGVSALLSGKSAFSSIDYREALEQAGEFDLVYMDPPYQGVCGERDQRYLSGISFDEFVVALEDLNARNVSYIVSYDGRRGDKIFGRPLPERLKLTLKELAAGRSTQSTLLGLNEVTYESLYLSQQLMDRIDKRILETGTPALQQFALFEKQENYA